MIKAIIFDYGKVISDSPGKSTKRDMAEAFNCDEETIGNTIGMFIKDFEVGDISEDVFWENISQQLKEPTPENKYELWSKSFRENLIIFEDMISYIKKLKSKNMKVAVISNNTQPWVDIIREQGGYDEFDLVLNSCEIGISKPNKEIYRLVLERLCVSPEETIFVDDRQENIDPAKRLGMYALVADDDREKLRSDINSIIEANS